MRTPQQVRHSSLSIVLAIGLAACVPTPAERVQPTESPASTNSPSSMDTLEPTASPDGPTPSPSFVRPSPNPSPTFLVYEVQPGDTLTSIARQFGTTARSLAYWNRVRYPSLDPDSATYAPNRIEAGWTLQLIPTAVVDEDELPDPTPTPVASSAPSPPAPSASPS
jgi:LysM repeat protein